MFAGEVKRAADHRSSSGGNVIGQIQRDAVASAIASFIRVIGKA
jgi:hypothetical protein